MVRGETIEEIRQLIQRVVNKMGIEADVETRELPNILVYNIRSSNSNLLIGQNGYNLAALQYLCRIMAFKNCGQNISFIVDVDNYKKRREAELVDIAQIARQQVLENQKAIVFKPLTSFERRIVHQTLSEFTDVESQSFGQEPKRYLVLYLAGQIPQWPEGFEYTQDSNFTLLS